MRFRKFFTCMLVFTLLFSSISMSMVYAEDDNETKLSEIKDAKKDKEQKLADGKKEEQALVSQIEAIDAQIANAEKEIQALEADINTTKTEIVAAKDELQKIQLKLTEQNDNLNQRLRVMYKSGNADMLQILLGSASITEFMTNLDMVQRIYDNDVDVLAQIQEQYDLLEAQKKALEALETKLLSQQEQQKQKKSALDSSKEDASILRNNIAASNEELEAQINQLNKEANQLTAIIQAAQSSNTVYSGGDGEMAWPVPGRYTITSPYGYRIHPILHTRKMHTGIDIGAPTGTHVVAANPGTVIMAKYYGGYGNTVMVDHGGGIVTLYAHNSSFAVSVGDSVVRGQVIAYAGSTGQSTGPHCHFEVRVNGEYTNPTAYL